MASNIRRILWNTRERLVSDDLRVSTDLHHRALIEAVNGIVSRGAQQTGVISGFTVSNSGSSMTVTIAPGIALRADGSAPTSYDSAVDWVESTVPITVNLTPYIPATNNRWVCVQIEPSDDVELLTTRDVWDPTAQAAVPQPVVKLRACSAVPSVMSGNTAASPFLPNGFAGAIPLCYIYLSAGMTGITDNRVYMCRPLLGSTVDSVDDQYTGGGINVTARSTQFQVNPAKVRFPGELITRSIARVSTYATFDLSNAAHREAFTYPPAVSGIIYVYLCKPPFPTGYTNLAPRELIAPSGSSYIGSANGCRNCIVVASRSGFNSETLKGTPIGSLVSGDPAWNGVPILGSDATYMGQMRVEGTSGDLGVQYTVGSRVSLYNSDVNTQTDAISEQQESTGAPVSGSWIDFHQENPLSGTGERLIDGEVEFRARVEVIAHTAGAASVGSTLLGPAGWTDLFAARLEGGSGSGLRSASVIDLPRGNGADFFWSVSNSSGDWTRLRVTTIGYTDSILAKRSVA